MTLCCHECFSNQLSYTLWANPKVDTDVELRHAGDSRLTASGNHSTEKYMIRYANDY